MKNTFIFIICCLGIWHLTADINNVYNIHNEKKIVEFNLYSGPVSIFGNKLIIHEQNSIKEYDIDPLGNLEMVSNLEKRSSVFGYLNEDRYYDLINFRGANLIQIGVYDLSQTPMEKITDIQIDTVYTLSTRLIFTDQHIIVTGQSDGGLILINKRSFGIDGYINNFYSFFPTELHNDLLVQVDVDPSIGSIARFYNLLYNPNNNNYIITYLSTISLGPEIGGIHDIIIEDSIVLLYGEGGATIIDASDVVNPVIQHQLILEEEYIYSALFQEEYLFLSTSNYNLLVYEIDSWGNFTLIFIDETGDNGSFRTLALQMPYLYRNAGSSFLTYDVQQNLNVVKQEERKLAPTFWSENNFYYHLCETIDPPVNRTNKYSFYSVFAEELFASLEVQDLYLHGFEISDEYLYAISADVNMIMYFQVYEISNQQLFLLNEISFDYEETILLRFYRNENRFYLETRPNADYYSRNVYIYDLLGTAFVYIDSFPGTINNQLGYQSANYLLNYNNNRLLIRDLTNYTHVLLERFVTNYPSLYAGDIFIHDENVLLLDANFLFNESFIYYFEVENASVSLVEHNTTQLNSFNKIIAKHNLDSSIIEFYTVSNNTLNYIGEFENNTYQENKVYFFPERNKMVTRSNASIKVYDFEYTVTKTKDQTYPPTQTQLFPNYPNPFNSTTTIKFYLPQSGKIKLSVYNVKGQLVKILLAAYLGAGEYTLRWNGTDDQNREVSSGIYFYRLQIGRDETVQRMILLQ